MLDVMLGLQVATMIRTAIAFVISLQLVLSVSLYPRSASATSAPVKAFVRNEVSSDNDPPKTKSAETMPASSNESPINAPQAVGGSWATIPDGPGASEIQNNDDIATMILNDKRFERLKYMIVQSGSDVTPLSTLMAGGMHYGSDQMFTVFAPSNKAIDDFLDEVNSPNYQRDLTGIIELHVVPGQLLAAEITDGLQLQTSKKYRALTTQVAGGGVTIDAGGPPASVTTPDIQASNGVIHIIDRVLQLKQGVTYLEAEIGVCPINVPHDDDSQSVCISANQIGCNIRIGARAKLKSILTDLKGVGLKLIEDIPSVNKPPETLRDIVPNDGKRERNRREPDSDIPILDILEFFGITEGNRGQNIVDYLDTTGFELCLDWE